MSCAWPKTHIVITGIEKVIPSLTDLALFWPLLATYGTGQKVTVYSTIVAGPRQENETDGRFLSPFGVGWGDDYFI